MYQWNPKEYQRSSSEQHRWASEIITRLGLQGTERVLDIGSGDGKVTAEMAALVPRGSVLGIDTSEAMVRFAQKEFPPAEFSNLDFRVGDARELCFDEEFDLVVSFACLHWVFDHRPVIAGIKNGLKPGGRTFLQFGGEGNAASVLEIVEGLIKHQKWSRFFEGFTFRYGFHSPARYREWLQGAGLMAKRVELIPKDMVHAGREGLKGWLSTTWLPYTQRLPEALREEFIDEIAERYLEDHPPDGAGQVHIQMVRLEVEASRT